MCLVLPEGLTASVIIAPLGTRCCLLEDITACLTYGGKDSRLARSSGRQQNVVRDPLSKEMTDWIRSGASNVCSMSWRRRQLTYGCHGL